MVQLGLVDIPFVSESWDYIFEYLTFGQTTEEMLTCQSAFISRAKKANMLIKVVAMWYLKVLLYLMQPN